MSPEACNAALTVIVGLAIVGLVLALIAWFAAR
jgi:hypothetical protein